MTLGADEAFPNGDRSDYAISEYSLIFRIFRKVSSGMARVRLAGRWTVGVNSAVLLSGFRRCR